MTDTVAKTMAVMWFAITLVWTGAALQLYGPAVGLAALALGGLANVWLHAVRTVAA